MYKKIITFITSALLCFALMSPVAVMAAETDTLEMTEEFANNKEEIQKRNEELYQKWNALTDKQKADVYKAVKGTVDAQSKFLDKLVKYNMMTKEDAQMIKDDMYAKFNEMEDKDALFSPNERPQNRENGKSQNTAPGSSQETVKPEPVQPEEKKESTKPAN